MTLSEMPRYSQFRRPISNKDVMTCLVPFAMVCLGIGIMDYAKYFGWSLTIVGVILTIFWPLYLASTKAPTAIREYRAAIHNLSKEQLLFLLGHEEELAQHEVSAIRASLNKRFPGWSYKPVQSAQ